jgi:hypothetical protein
MLTPAEEVGLAGQRLASRVQRALDAIPPDEMRELIQSIHALATDRHLYYQREGLTETIRLLPCPVTLRQDQVAYLHYTTSRRRFTTVSSSCPTCTSPIRQLTGFSV